MAVHVVVGSKIVAAYQRGDLFDKRTRPMEAWAAFCESGAATRDQ